MVSCFVFFYLSRLFVLGSFVGEHEGSYLNRLWLTRSECRRLLTTVYLYLKRPPAPNYQHTIDWLIAVKRLFAIRQSCKKYNIKDKFRFSICQKKRNMYFLIRVSESQWKFDIHFVKFFVLYMYPGYQKKTVEPLAFILLFRRSPKIKIWILLTDCCISSKDIVKMYWSCQAKSDVDHLNRHGEIFIDILGTLDKEALMPVCYRMLH